MKPLPTVEKMLEECLQCLDDINNPELHALKAERKYNEAERKRQSERECEALTADLSNSPWR